MKKIKLFPAPHIESDLRTDEWERDYLESEKI